MPEETNGVAEPTEPVVDEGGSTPESSPTEEVAPANADTADAPASEVSPEGSEQSQTEIDPELKRAQNQAKAAQREAAELKKQLEEKAAPAEEGKLKPEELTPEANQFLDLATERAVARIKDEQKKAEFDNVVSESEKKGRDEWKSLFGKEMTDEDVHDMREWALEQGKGVFVPDLETAILKRHKNEYIKKAQADILKGKVADESKQVETGGKGTPDASPTKTQNSSIPKSIKEEQEMLRKALGA